MTRPASAKGQAPSAGAGMRRLGSMLIQPTALTEGDGLLQRGSLAAADAEEPAGGAEGQPSVSLHPGSHGAAQPRPAQERLGGGGVRRRVEGRSRRLPRGLSATPASSALAMSNMHQLDVGAAEPQAAADLPSLQWREAAGPPPAPGLRASPWDASPKLSALHSSSPIAELVKQRTLDHQARRRLGMQPRAC